VWGNHAAAELPARSADLMLPQASPRKMRIRCEIGCRFDLEFSPAPLRQEAWGFEPTRTVQ
jgi:hypothetical protein